MGAARPDAPALALHLVLARLDDEAKEIVGVGEAAQLGEADRLVGARPGGEIVAGRKIEAAAGDVRRRDRPEGIERTEPVGAGAARDAPPFPSPACGGGLGGGAVRHRI